MGRIQSSVGLVTGVQIDSTVDQLMKLNAIPRDRLQSRITAMQSEQTAVTELMTQVVALQLATDRLGQQSLYSATNVASSDSKLLSARSTGSPTPGSYSFVPVRLAQNQQQTSSLLAASDQTLKAGQVVIHAGGFLDTSVGLDQLNGGLGVARGSIRITDRSGVSQEIDLRFAQSANDVVDAINANDTLSVVARLDGDRFVLQDVSGSSAGNLRVSEVAGGRTAADLGLAGISTASSTAEGARVLALDPSTALRSLRDGRGLELPRSGPALQFTLRDGTSLQYTPSLNAHKATLGQLVDELNAAASGKLNVAIAADGKSLQVEDLTSGGGQFSITSPNGKLATQLGWDKPATAGVIVGDRLLAGLSDSLLSSLKGGRGLAPLGELSITNRSGVTTSVDLSAATSLQDVLAAINDSDAGVSARLNQAATGIEIVDTTGSTAHALRIADGDATLSATHLQIAAEVDAARIDSGSLAKQYITRGTLVSDWKQGTGLTLGSIQLTDSSGVKAGLNLSTLKPQTIGDIVDAINGLSVSIEARFNETGDGLILVDTAGGQGTLTVADVGSGQAAQQLGIAGSGKQHTLDGQSVLAIDGAQTIRVTTTAETTVTELVEKLNALPGGPVNASLLNVGSDGGVRVLLNSTAAGVRGRVALSGDVGLSFSQTTQAQDALLAFGASDTSGGVLVASSSNTFKGIIKDVEVTITGASQSPVTVNITENTESVSKQITTFVEQYNKLRTKYEQVTAFDSTTNSVGVLFGKSVALRLDLAYGRFLSGALRGTGSINSLGQVGVRLTDQGKLEFDQSKFDALMASNPQAVKEFFATEETGFSAQAKALADSLAGIDNGALLNSSNSLQSKIEQHTKRVETMNVRLEKQRERLLKQFYGMEAAIAKLQNNLTALNQLQIIPPLGSQQ